MKPSAVARLADAPSIQELARCLSCGARLGCESQCRNCERDHGFHDGILDAIGPLTGRNRIAASFYDGPGWVRFRPWEQGFLMLQGGIRQARMQILHHLQPHLPGSTCGLEVGIGSGENVAFLREDWTLYGVDIARRSSGSAPAAIPPSAGIWRAPRPKTFLSTTRPLMLAGPSAASTTTTITSKPCASMRRVTRPGGPVVVADERPSLHRAGLGHLIGIPSFDAWWLRRLGLDREFVDMVLQFDVDLAQVFRRVWPEASHHRIWHGLGYCVVDRSRS